MGNSKINICSFGDPTCPKTWSGTPFNLYSELKEKDYLGAPFSSRAFESRFLQSAMDVVSKIYYSNSNNIHHGVIQRYLNGRKVFTESLKSNTNITLHTGTKGLPLPKVPKGHKHYLFCDSTWNLWATQSTEMNGCKKKLLKDAEELEIKAYNQMEHIFPISQYVKDSLTSHYRIDPNKITVVGTGLGVIKPFFGKKDYLNGKILFAAKGRFDDKGGPLVLEAFSKALKKNPNLELIIVGQNDYVTKVSLPKVKTYGFIPIEELQRIFNESSLFLMPAINEPWGLVYLEALACKMPIVGLNRNSFPEISGNGKYGFGLNEPDPDKLSDFLINAFSDPLKLESMGAAGQEYCLENFAWHKTVSKIVNTINN